MQAISRSLVSKRRLAFFYLSAVCVAQSSGEGSPRNPREAVKATTAAERRDTIRHRQEMERTAIRLLSEIERPGESSLAARHELHARDDAEFVGAVVRHMEQLSESTREFIVEAIAKMTNHAVDEALATIAIADDSPMLRKSTTTRLLARKPAPASYATPLVGGLTSRDERLLYAAAEFAVSVDEEQVIPLLIDVMYTPVTTRVRLPGIYPRYSMIGAPRDLYVTDTGNAYSLRFGGGGGIGAGSPKTGPRRFTIGYQGSVLNRMSVVRPDPVVNPTARPMRKGAPITQAPSGKSSSHRVNAHPFVHHDPDRIVDVTSWFRHETVYQSLKAISKEDLGYDPEAWRNWWALKGSKSLGELAGELDRMVPERDLSDRPEKAADVPPPSRDADEPKIPPVLRRVVPERAGRG